MKYSDTRITHEAITQIKDGEVFVFGSNESGYHAGGAARIALDWGAVYGQAEGLQGNTYAIPTIAENYTGILSVMQIKPYVDRFIAFAEENPHLTFYVTQIGCGIAGMQPSQIAPLFIRAIPINNIHLPAVFWDQLDDEKTK